MKLCAMSKLICSTTTGNYLSSDRERKVISNFVTDLVHTSMSTSKMFCVTRHAYIQRQRNHTCIQFHIVTTATECSKKGTIPKNICSQTKTKSGMVLLSHKRFEKTDSSQSISHSKLGSLLRGTPVCWKGRMRVARHTPGFLLFTLESLAFQIPRISRMAASSCLHLFSAPRSP